MSRFNHSVQSWRFVDGRITHSTGRGWNWTPLNADNGYGLALESWFKVPEAHRERIRYRVTP